MPEPSPALNLTRKLIISFIILACIAAAFCISFNANNKNLLTATSWVDHTKEVLHKSEQLQFEVTELENESRTFVITGNTRFIDSFYKAKNHALIYIEELGHLVSDNPAQQQRTAELASLVDARIRFAEDLVKAYKASGFEEARSFLLRGRGTQLSDSIRHIIYGIEQEETMLLEARQATSMRHSNISQFLMYSLQAMLLLVLLATIITVVRTFKIRRAAEEELRESREWFRKTLTCIGDGVIATDTSGVITFMNPVAEQLSGYTFNEAGGKPIETVFEIVNEGTGSATENPVRQVLKEQQIKELVNHSVLIKKDNTRIPIADSAAPIFNTTEELIGVVLVFRNVARERQAEKAIRDARDRFFRIFDLSPVAMVISELDTGKILFINKAFSQMLLNNSEDIPGKTVVEAGLISAKEREALVQKLNERKSREGVEVEFHTVAGEKKFVLVHREVMEIDGKMRSIASLLDITDRKFRELEIEQLNKELEKSIEQQKALNKELESFSYSVSHDLRAPLRSIDGYTRILLEDYAEKLDDEARRLMSVVMNNAQKMNKLIDDLLMFSRLGKQPVEKTELNMNVMFQSIINELKNHKQADHAEFELKPLLPAHGDRNLITQVITNLLSNAIKYSSKKEKPRIEIGSYEENGFNVYYVKDNGAGFDMAYYEKLFGIFQRLHTASEFEGTGVGLAIVQRIINRHEGKVWAEAKPGEGATFYFSLPK